MPKLNLHKDPSTFGEGVPRAIRSRLILGIDMGTCCGYAFHYWRPGQPVLVRPEHMGQWDLSAGPYDSGAIRFVRLRQFLEFTRPDLVAYEEVRFTPSEKVTKYNAASLMHRAATSMELFGAFRATICTWCEENGVPCTSFPIKTIKKRATAKGISNKEDVIRACNETFGTDFDPETYNNTGVDNVADAAWLCLLAQEQYGLGLEYPKEDEEGGARTEDQAG